MYGKNLCTRDLFWGISGLVKGLYTTVHINIQYWDNEYSYSTYTLFSTGMYLVHQPSSRNLSYKYILEGTYKIVSLISAMLYIHSSYSGGLIPLQILLITLIILSPIAVSLHSRVKQASFWIWFHSLRETTTESVPLWQLVKDMLSCQNEQSSDCQLSVLILDIT